MEFAKSFSAFALNRSDPYSFVTNFTITRWHGWLGLAYNRRKKIYCHFTMKDKHALKLAAVGMVAMFLASGVMKIKSWGASEAERFSLRTGMCKPNSQRIVFLAGIIELFGAFLILQGVLQDKRSNVELGAAILAVFTVLATLIFYTNPLKPYPFLSNLAVLSGLILLPMVCAIRN